MNSNESKQIITQLLYFNNMISPLSDACILINDPENNEYLS